MIHTHSATNKADINRLDADSSQKEGIAVGAFEAEKEHNARKRTTGLKLFDVFLYPVLTNAGVFVISVMATYLTSHGDKMGGKVGRFFFNRGEWFKSKATGAGLSNDQADMAKMVFFSFLDGSLMAPFIKMLEDRREKIAKKLDTLLGTKPDDESVYSAEPKQGWLSVLTGRFAAAAIVVPTAVVLDKAGLNRVLFSEPGLKTGRAFVTTFPRVAEKFSRFDLPGLFKVGFFEAFYTSVCTSGLYVASRFIAKKTEKSLVSSSFSAKNEGETEQNDNTHQADMKHEEKTISATGNWQKRVQNGQKNFALTL